MDARTQDYVGRTKSGVKTIKCLQLKMAMMATKIKFKLCTGDKA